MFLGDFHIHSTFSDGKLPIPKIVDLYGRHGFGAIAITDHLCEDRTFLGKAARYVGRTLTPGSFPVYMEILKSEAERAWRQYRMVVIPGVEFTKNSFNHSRSAHFLGLGVKNYYEPQADVETCLRELRRGNVLTVAAHPAGAEGLELQTRILWNRREELSGLFDAWEVASGPCMFPQVLSSSLPKLANSDFHRVRHLVSWKTVFRCERHPQAILEAIRRQDLSFQFFDGVQRHVLHELDLSGSMVPFHPTAGMRNLSGSASF